MSSPRRRLTHEGKSRSRATAALAAAAASAGAAAAFVKPQGSPGVPLRGFRLRAGVSSATPGAAASPQREAARGNGGAAGAFGLSILALQRALTRTSASAGASVQPDAAVAFSRGRGQERLTGWALATAVVLVVAGWSAQPANAVESFPLDLFNPWESFVNLNANLIIGIDSLVGSAGIALLIYTVFAKILTYPVYQTSLRTSALMRIISPQVKQIQTQYQSDEALRNKAIQALYQKVGVNPLDGLLPVLAQLPVFLALFYAIKKLALSDEHFKEPFLWIPSLAGPAEAGNPSLDWLIKSQSADSFIPLVGWTDAAQYLILPVVLLATQLALAKVQAAPKDPDAVSLTFPFIVGASTLVSPQGLGIYWLTNSLITAGQTSFTRGQVAEEFPEFKETFEEVAKDEPTGIQKGDKVMYKGRTGTVIYGPDTDGDCKLKFEDGTESSYMKDYELRRPGALDDSVEAVVQQAVPAAAAPKTRKQRKAAKERTKRDRRRMRGKR